MKNSSNSIKSTIESLKSFQENSSSKISNMKSERKGVAKWNIEGTLSSLDSVSNSSETSQNEVVQPNSNHRFEYGCLSDKRIPNVDQKYSMILSKKYLKIINGFNIVYRLFDNFNPNTLILLNEIERLKNKRTKLDAKIKHYSSKNICS